MENQLLMESAFKRMVCDECTICHPDHDPAFCYMFIHNSKDNFIKRVIRTGKIVDKCSSIDREFLTSPHGFLELMCNGMCHGSKVSNTCGDLTQKLSCYLYWRTGYQGSITARDINDVMYGYNITSDTAMYRKIPLIDSAWQSLSKKKKKKVRKKLRQMDHKLSDKAKVATKTKPVEPPTTTIFYTDDEEWEKHINAVLSK